MKRFEFVVDVFVFLLSAAIVVVLAIDAAQSSGLTFALDVFVAALLTVSLVFRIAVAWWCAR